MGRLDQLDLSAAINRKEYDRRLIDAQQRFLQLRLHLGGQMGDDGIGPGLLVVMEGLDAAGKGGAIRHLVEPLDPRHFTVFSFSKPTYDEKRHHHLWRFYRQLPGLGGMAVFDRSWYGRVLVERIEGFATPEQWQRGYQEIVDFETTLVHEGVILVKFWMQISDHEQLRRFEARAGDPLKRWKLTEEDWRNRKRSREYEAAAEDMFERTDHELAPWDVLSGEQKRLARVEVIERLNERVEQGMVRWGWEVPAQHDLHLDND
jgi:polyphosphate kinase 2 (PPK2 family)